MRFDQVADLLLDRLAIRKIKFYRRIAFCVLITLAVLTTAFASAEPGNGLQTSKSFPDRQTASPKFDAEVNIIE